MKKDEEMKVVLFFKQQDDKFLAACARVGLTPTKRQASKWLRGVGKAWKEGR